MENSLNAKYTLFNVQARWEKNNKYYMQDFVLCAKDADSAKTKIIKQLSMTSDTPQITVESKTDKCESKIEKIYYHSEIRPVKREKEQTVSDETALTSLFLVLWGQEIGWRKKSAELSDADKLCLSKLLAEDNPHKLLSSWAKQAVSSKDEPEEYFITRLSEYIGAEINNVNAMSPISDNQFTRMKKDAEEKARQIIENAEKQADEKLRAAGSQLRIINDTVHKLNEIIANGVNIVPQTEPISTDVLPDENDAEIEPDDADDEQFYEGDNSEKTDTENKTEISEEQADISETSSDEQTNQKQTDEQNNEDNNTSQNEIPQTPSNDLAEHNVIDETDDEPSVETMIAGMRHLNPAIIIDELKTMGCINTDKNGEHKMCNGYETYVRYCKLYRQNVEPYRLDIIINVIKMAAPITTENKPPMSALRYLYEKYCVSTKSDEAIS